MHCYLLNLMQNVRIRNWTSMACDCAQYKKYKQLSPVTYDILILSLAPLLLFVFFLRQTIINRSETGTNIRIRNWTLSRQIVVTIVASIQSDSKFIRIRKRARWYKILGHKKHKEKEKGLLWYTKKFQDRKLDFVQNQFFTHIHIFIPVLTLKFH